MKNVLIYISDGTGTTISPPIGSTHDPCRDSGDIDCKQMNDTLRMCEQKMSPPTLLYCPKFCGLCTPSADPSSTCADSQEMDCKLANDSMHICLHHTPIAVKHCSKFCGYCTSLFVLVFTRKLQSLWQIGWVWILHSVLLFCGGFFYVVCKTVGTT